MIKVFSSTDKLFSSNGDVVLRPLKARVKKEDNGDYYLDLETGLDYVDYLVEGNIVVANTPQGDQAFRITNPQKTRSKITVKAWHVFYDSENYLIADSYVVDKNCNDALDHLNMATEPESPFTTISDVGTINSFRCVRKSLYEAIQTVLERWGGHLVRNDFNIEIRDTIGQDNGVVVQYKKNLKSISCQEDWTNVVTKLMPVGKDGILLPERYVTSDIQYDLPYTKAVSFSQSIDEEDYASEKAYQEALIADLRVQAQAYVDEYCLPRVNYSLKANLEKITDIGDVIQVVDDRLGIDIMTNVISYTYDCILEKYIDVEFGNFTHKLGNLISDIVSSANKTTGETVADMRSTLEKELVEATDRINAMMNNSYLIYDGNQLLAVDKLPKEEATYCLRITSGGIGFSNTGINGTFNSAWTIDGKLDMQAITVLNLTASLIHGGVLKLGALDNIDGSLEVYNASGEKIGSWDKNGITAMNGSFEGTIESNNGSIGGWTIDRNGLTNAAVRINSDGSSTIYTVADLLIIKNHIMQLDGWVLSGTMLDHYDLNGDGIVSSQDYVRLKNLIGLDPD